MKNNISGDNARGPLSPRDREALAYEDARHQVRRLRGFYKNASLYAIVICGLAVINLVTSPHRLWFLFPAAGWGLGLAVHAFSIWGGQFWLGRDWEEKKIQQILSREKIRTLSTEKQLLEARMRLLQAQIEPHFLFNTLANVVSLIDPAPAKARLMLENFISYLRGSLAASRSTEGTLDQELSLLRHYLSLLQIRMGDRLSYDIDVEPGLGQTSIAPMLLQPIVENAIRHGLEPKLEGGKVSISVKRHALGVLVSVVDNGLGFKPGPQSGIGLENLRERLQVLYEGAATLSIQEGNPGTLVTLILPSNL